MSLVEAGGEGKDNIGPEADNGESLARTSVEVPSGARARRVVASRSPHDLDVDREPFEFVSWR